MKPRGLHPQKKEDVWTRSKKKLVDDCKTIQRRRRAARGTAGRDGTLKRKKGGLKVDGRRKYLRVHTFARSAKKKGRGSAHPKTMLSQKRVELGRKGKKWRRGDGKACIRSRRKGGCKCRKPTPCASFRGRGRTAESAKGYRPAARRKRRENRDQGGLGDYPLQKKGPFAVLERKGVPVISRNGKKLGGSSIEEKAHRGDGMPGPGKTPGRGQEKTGPSTEKKKNRSRPKSF